MEKVVRTLGLFKKKDDDTPRPIDVERLNEKYGKDITKSKGSATPDNKLPKLPKGKKEILCVWCEPKGSGYRRNGAFCTTCSGHGVLWVDEK